jgi:hypothetical protein
MAESHSYLKITSKEWEAAFLDDFQQTLDKFAVPTAEQGGVKAIINNTRADSGYCDRLRARTERGTSISSRRSRLSSLLWNGEPGSEI